jgi:hypothetical protein
VNPVCGKMPVKREFSQLRDATVDLVLYYNIIYIGKNCISAGSQQDLTTCSAVTGTVQYSTVQRSAIRYSGVSKVNPVYDKTGVKSDLTQSRDAKLRNLRILSSQSRACPSKLDFVVNKTVKKE